MKALYLLVFSMLPLLAQSELPKDARLKPSITAGSLMTCIGIGLHFIKKRPMRLEKVAQNFAAIKQSSLLAQRYATAHSFLRSYEQQHTIPTVIKELSAVQESIEKTMD